MKTSPSSSSTSSTSITLGSSSSVIGFLGDLVVGSLLVGGLVLGGLVHRLGGHGQGEQEPGAFGVAAVHPYPPAKVLDDLPGHGQPDAGARVGGPLVQALEDHEDPFGVVGLDPDAVVAEREQPERLRPGAGGYDSPPLSGARP